MTTHKAKHLTDPKWFMVRSQQWPNGTRYFTVENRSGQCVAGRSGGISKFYDRAQAEQVRDEMNGKASKDEDALWEEFIK
jgi:hypothetical protein